MNFKFIHAADVHLDSPLHGLSQYSGKAIEQIQGASRQAFENLINLCIEEDVKFLLIAGDLYDGDWRDYNTGLFFSSQMGKLRVNNIKVFIVKGNHDASSQISRQLRFPDNVKDFSTKHAETAKYIEGDIKVAIHGFGYDKQAVMEDISIQYPPAEEGFINIGLLHTSVAGKEGHEPYAPCNQKYLETKGYDYWALGHIHSREILKAGDPWIVFPGNIQGRHIRETGEKGCTIVTVSDSRIMSIEHRNLDVIRWQVCDIDVTGIDIDNEIIEFIANKVKQLVDGSTGYLYAVRIIVSGISSLHDDFFDNEVYWKTNIGTAITDTCSGNVWIEKIKFRTERVLNTAQMETIPHIGFVKRYISELANDQDSLKELAEEFAAFRNAFPKQYNKVTAEEEITFDKEMIKKSLPEAETIIMNRLLSVGKGRNA